MGEMAFKVCLPEFSFCSFGLKVGFCLLASSCWFFAVGFYSKFLASQYTKTEKLFGTYFSAFSLSFQKPIF